MIPTNVTVAHVAFLLGTVYQLRKLSGDWLVALKVIGGALVVSLVLTLAPFKNETSYSLADHLNAWPFFFAVTALGFVLFSYSRELIPRLGEGTALVHSTAFTYWVTELTRGGPRKELWIGLTLLPLLYSLAHALTLTELRRTDRLLLSVWSSAVTGAFGAVYLFGVLHMDGLEATLSGDQLARTVSIFIEYVLLGMTGPYLAENWFLVLDYLPSRNEFFNAAYFKNLSELNHDHVARLSPDQVDRLGAALVFLLLVAFFAANYRLRLVPTSLAIWLVLALSPTTARFLSNRGALRPRR